jgi:hypothetical protein
MMKKMLILLMAAAALLVTAQASDARTYPDNVPYCENWEGTWAITYADGDASVTDNVTFTDICKQDEDCLIGENPSMFWCQATGTRASDNQTILIAQVAMDPNNYGYYEIDNTTVLDQNTPYDSIALETLNIECDTFVGAIGPNAVDDFGLLSGKKIGSPDNCTDDNETICELQKIIPGKISRLMAVFQPLMPFVIIADEQTAFVKEDKAAFDSDALTALIQVRIGKRLLVVIARVKPFQLTAGDIAVTVGDCAGTITVR